jgi:NAD(P)-dependent dehydrogenase (short-subunit alcohol dehydrogenase family)
MNRSVMALPFDGRVCLVTGAGTGIGAATAELVAERGAKVAVLGLPSDPLENTVRRIEAAGGSATAIAADVSNPAQMQAAVEQVGRRLGSLTLAVNAAGISGIQAYVYEEPVEDWMRVIETNLCGTFYSLRAEINAMRAAGTGGSIVNVASVHASHPNAQRNAYTASKHGIAGLTKNAALECITDGIRINVVSPGTTDTPMMRSGGQQSADTLIRVPIGRIAQPIEIARCIAFMLSDEASYVTGAELTADGGQLLNLSTGRAGVLALGGSKRQRYDAGPREVGDDLS